mgnify:CR=1 FL=1
MNDLVESDMSLATLVYYIYLNPHIISRLRILLSPLLGRGNSSLLVLLPVLCHISRQWVIRVGGTQ